MMSGTILNRIRCFRGYSVYRNCNAYILSNGVDNCHTFIHGRVNLKPSSNLMLKNVGFRKSFSTLKAYQSNQWKDVAVSGSGSSNIKLTRDGIVLTHGDHEIEILYIWLRDHCRSEICYNHSTFQRNFDNYKLSPDEVPSRMEIDSSEIVITWSDGHITKYDLNWLVDNTYHTGHKDLIQKVTWDKSTIQSLELPTVQYQEYMESEEGLKKHVQNLIKFGFSFIAGALPTLEGTLEVSKRLSFFQRTHYGEFWNLTANSARADLSYTNSALFAHTDTTYFTTPAGVQVFHVVEKDGTGGETLLVDGQHCANRLKEKHPESYELLTKFVIPHEYFETGIKIRSYGTVLTVHPTTGDFENLRFHPGNRSPMFTLPVEDQRAFYRAYNHLLTEIRCPDNEVWMKLVPGMVLFTDNWRLLHGRSSFTGKRVLCGLYIPRDDFMGIAREYKMINL